MQGKKNTDKIQCIFLNFLKIQCIFKDIIHMPQIQHLNVNSVVLVGIHKVTQS